MPEVSFAIERAVAAYRALAPRDHQISKARQWGRRRQARGPSETSAWSVVPLDVGSIL
jgi:hypothetical protein